MHKILSFAVLLLLSMSANSFATVLNCELRSMHREADPGTDEFIGPVGFPGCKLNGKQLSVDGKTGFAHFTVDGLSSEARIECDASLNALIKIKLPVASIAISDKAGKILDARTDFLALLSKKSFVVKQMPRSEAYTDYLSLSCWK